MIRLFVFIFIYAFVCSLELVSQGWQPAAHIRNALMWPNYIQASDGQTLIPLRQVLPNQKDTLLFFSVNSMLTAPVPWHIQPPAKVVDLNAVYDANGDGRHDIMVITYPQATKLIFSACTEQQMLQDTFPEGGSAPASSSLNRYKADIDGDGVQDVLTAVYREQFAQICFGDRVNPYTDWSIVPTTISASDSPATRIIAVGKLSGKHCMVQLVYKSQNYAFYQLMELDQSDITARRDTIRTQLLHEIRSTDGKYYGLKILRADTVWHLFPDGTFDENKALSVTLTSVKIEPSASGIGDGSWNFWFGHGRETGDWTFPVVMDADRPFIAESSKIDSLQRSVLLYYVCINTNSAEIRLLGEALLPNSAKSPGSVGRVVLIPDQDGDGIEDIVTEHYWYDPQTEQSMRGVSVFLTTQRDPVSVQGENRPIPIDTTHALQAFRTHQGWLVRGAASCSANATQGIVYSLLGEQVGTLNVTVQGLDLLVQRGGVELTLPAWVVVNGCVIGLF